MKKLILLFALITALLSGCKKDDENGLGKFDYDTELIFGTWKVIKIGELNWTLQTTTASFNSDGTYYGKGYFGTGSGTYKLSGKRITCYVDGQKYMWYDVVSLSNTECTLIASDSSGSISITCKKQ